MSTPAGERAPIARAMEAVEFGLRACEAYQRPDLAARLTAAKRSLADPVVHIVVAGEFKQGKSSLVNALVGAPVCPVDDDVATAVPTYVRHGPAPSAELIFDVDPPRRQAISMAEVRPYVVEGGRPPSTGDRLVGVEVRLPRKLLESGVVLVDTPGVGGLGSAHAAASLAAISMAQAVIFVTDASQELTRSELDFLRQARDLCSTVVCVLTKTDFYPAWRRIRDLDESHLRGRLDVPIMSVSSSLRTLAVTANDAAMNAESGFSSMVNFVSEQVGGGAANRLAVEAAADVISVCDQLIGQFEAERTALADPAAAQAVIADLMATKQRVEALRTAASRWSMTLNDGIADLNADIDHDLRARVRQVTQEADDAVDESDPADTWNAMEAWLQSRVSFEVLANYTGLRRRSQELSEQVAEHFRTASGDVFNQIGVYNPTPLASQLRVDHKIELERMKAGKKAMVAMRSGYGGVIMFTMLGSLAHIALGPIPIGIGLVMGHKGLRDEKKRLLMQRRSQAKNAVRRYCDEVNFVMGKDSRDTLRRIQRQLRDYYSGIAEELGQSNSEALRAATEAATRTQAEREKRVRDLDAELARLRQLRQAAAAIAGQS
jgi:GTPase SAR1 family protein